MPSLQSRILAFVIRRQNLFGGTSVDPLRLRAIVERQGATARPRKGVRVESVDAGGVPAEWLIPPGAPEDRALLYFHGGAWFMGSARTHRGLVSRLAFAAGVRALSIDYRLAPEHPFPAGLEDCLAAYDWLQRIGIQSRRIAVAGDSAGGNLALAMLIALRDAGKPLPAAAAALSAPTDLAATGELPRTRARLDPFFHSAAGLAAVLKIYCGDRDPREKLISPLYDDLHGLPPLLLHVGDHEALRDDSVRFGEKAAAAGVNARTVVWPGMFHVFQMFDPLLPEAGQANGQIGAFIRARLGAGPSTPQPNVRKPQ
jgi:acetyl esterase/lipase